MPKLNLFIIRHGEKNEDGSELTSRGRKQVKLLAKRLKFLNINEIYSSTTGRCKETSKIISSYLRLPINYSDSLNEVPSKVKELPKTHKKEIAIIQKIWDELIKKEGNILVVTSGIVLRILISLGLEIPSNKANLMQYPTGLTRIEKKENGKFRVWHINDTSHLKNKLRVLQSN